MLKCFSLKPWTKTVNRTNTTEENEQRFRFTNILSAESDTWMMEKCLFSLVLCVLSSYKLWRLAAASAIVYRHFSYFVLVCDTRAAGESGRRLLWFTQVVSSGHSASSALSPRVETGAEMMNLWPRTLCVNWHSDVSARPPLAHSLCRVFAASLALFRPVPLSICHVSPAISGFLFRLVISAGGSADWGAAPDRLHDSFFGHWFSLRAF